MALCFRFTSSTFSEILSMKPRISSTCGPRPGDEEKIQVTEASWAPGLSSVGPEIRLRARLLLVVGGGLLQAPSTPG